MIFTWGYALNCWNSFATCILAVSDPYFLKSCEKSGLQMSSDTYGGKLRINKAEYIITCY